MVAKLYRMTCRMAMLYLCFQSLSAWSGDLPRMWEVTAKGKDGAAKKFHILGITHQGYDFEYNAYLNNKVLPVFKAADVLLNESALMDASKVSACARPLADTPENSEMLAKVRRRVQDLMAVKFETQLVVTAPAGVTPEMIQSFKKQSAITQAANLSEFGLLLALEQEKKYIESLKRNSIFERMRNFFRPRATSVDAYLVKLDRKKVVLSVDTPQDIVDAYCRVENRSAEFKRRAIYFDPDFDPEAVATVTKKLETSIVESLRSQTLTADLVNDYPSHDYFIASVCERNKTWANKMINDVDRGSRFYALGLSHLLPMPRPNPNCPDLISILRGKGLVVALVR